jgi:hypothetical protein
LGGITESFFTVGADRWNFPHIPWINPRILLTRVGILLKLAFAEAVVVHHVGSVLSRVKSPAIALGIKQDHIMLAGKSPLRGPACPITPNQFILEATPKGTKNTIGNYL